MLRQLIEVLLLGIILTVFPVFSQIRKGIESENRIYSSHKGVNQISLIADKFFLRGLAKVRGNGLYDGYLSLFNNNFQHPLWNIAEWGTKNHLSQKSKSNSGYQVIFSNSAKSISFKKSSLDIEVEMSVQASEEYNHPRKINESWPHLLIEQEFLYKPLIKDLANLILKFKGKLLFSKRIMNSVEYDSSLHTAQFQLFIMVKNINKKSKDYDDFLWFGIPFYDYRHEFSPIYAAQDIGKDDATGKFIYNIASKDFMEGSFHDNEWHSINQDIYPYIIEALLLAKERGYLVGSNVEDFRLLGMNLGWEVPGTFNVNFVFNSFDILAFIKK